MTIHFLPMHVSCVGTLQYLQNTCPDDEEGVRRLMMSFPDMELRIAKMLFKYEAKFVDIPNSSEADIVIFPWFVTYTRGDITNHFGPFNDQEEANRYIDSRTRIAKDMKAHMMFPL